MHNPVSFHQRGIFGMFHFTVSLCSFLRFCVSVSFHSQNSWSKSDLKWGPWFDIKSQQVSGGNPQGLGENMQNSTYCNLSWGSNSGAVRRQRYALYHRYTDVVLRTATKCIKMSVNLLRFATVYRWICTKYSLYPTFFPPFPSPSFCHSPLVTPVSSLRSEPHLLSLRNFCED